MYFKLENFSLLANLRLVSKAISDCIGVKTTPGNYFTTQSFFKKVEFSFLLFFLRNPALCRASIFLNFPDFELRIILTLFICIKGVAAPKYSMNIFQSSLMFYYIIKLRKSFNEYIPIFFDVLLHHKTKEEFMYLDETSVSHYS